MAGMLTEYIELAMSQACIEKGEDGLYIATIPGFQGPWSYGKTPEEARRDLRSVFEVWLILSLRDDDELPEMDGVSLNFGGRGWRCQQAAVS